MSDLPKSLRIGYRVYSVEEYDAELADAAGDLGECNKSIARIRVKLAGLDRAEIANVLLHELFHGIWRDRDLDPSYEEPVITALVNGFLSVWKDEPELIRFISESLSS